MSEGGTVKQENQVQGHHRPLDPATTSTFPAPASYPAPGTFWIHIKEAPDKMFSLQRAVGGPSGPFWSTVFKPRK